MTEYLTLEDVLSLVEDLVDLLGKLICLLLLECDARHSSPGAYLEVERPRARKADSSDDGPIRPVEVVNT